MPLEMMTKLNAEMIGRVIEKLQMVEDLSWTHGVGRYFLRICVAINVNRPLVAGFWIPRKGKERFWLG